MTTTSKIGFFMQGLRLKVLLFVNLFSLFGLIYLFINISDKRTAIYWISYVIFLFFPLFFLLIIAILWKNAQWKDKASKT